LSMPWQDAVTYFSERKDQRIVASVVESVSNTSYEKADLYSILRNVKATGPNFPSCSQKRVIYFLQKRTGTSFLQSSPEETKHKVLEWWETNKDNPKYRF
ncbi:uncharacterized protein METZ01_LOCUS441073, partial [marine metagenome]